MVIYKAKDYQDMSRKAANIISAQIIMKPNCVLGLATGSSPVGTYKQLIEWYKKVDLDFSQVTVCKPILYFFDGAGGDRYQTLFAAFAFHLDESFLEVKVGDFQVTQFRHA